MSENEEIVLTKLYAIIYAESSTPSEVALKMAEIELEEEKELMSVDDYEVNKAELHQKYKQKLSRYKKGRQPREKNRLRLQKARGWSDVKLQFALSPKDLRGNNSIKNLTEKEKAELVRIDPEMSCLLGSERKASIQEKVLVTIPPQPKHDSGLSSCISLEKEFKNFLYNHSCGQGGNINSNLLNTSPLSLNSKNFNYSENKELIVAQSTAEGVNRNILDFDDKAQYDFKLLSLQVKACYYENRSFRWRKIYRILFLRDGVSKIKNLDYFEIEGKSVDIFYRKDKFLLVPKAGITATSDFLTVELHSPSRIGQILDIVIDYFCPELYRGGNTFGGTLLRFPIPLLGLDFAPPYPERNKSAEVLQFESLEDYRGFGESNNLGQLSLNPLTNSFQAVYSDLRTSFLMLPWGSCAA
jgi:hypothetical protein